jgi:hypothetical protein
MTDGSAPILMVDGIERFREVTWARTDVQNRGGGTEDVVNLARMPQPPRELDEEVNDLRLQQAEGAGGLGSLTAWGGSFSSTANIMPSVYTMRFKLFNKK